MIMRFIALQRNIQMLPASLPEALAELEKDELVRDTLGDHILERYIEAKTEEWDEFRMQVTQWELERYLDVY